MNNSTPLVNFWMIDQELAKVYDILEPILSKLEDSRNTEHRSLNEYCKALLNLQLIASKASGNISSSVIQVNLANYHLKVLRNKQNVLNTSLYTLDQIIENKNEFLNKYKNIIKQYSTITNIDSKELSMKKIFNTTDKNLRTSVEKVESESFKQELSNIVYKETVNGILEGTKSALKIGGLLSIIGIGTIIAAVTPVISISIFATAGTYSALSITTGVIQGRKKGNEQKLKIEDSEKLNINQKLKHIYDLCIQSSVLNETEKKIFKNIITFQNEMDLTQTDLKQVLSKLDFIVSSEIKANELLNKSSNKLNEALIQINNIKSYLEEYEQDRDNYISTIEDIIKQGTPDDKETMKKILEIAKNNIEYRHTKIKNFFSILDNLKQNLHITDFNSLKDKHKNIINTLDKEKEKLETEVTKTFRNLLIDQTQKLSEIGISTGSLEEEIKSSFKEPIFTLDQNTGYYLIKQYALIYSKIQSHLNEEQKQEFSPTRIKEKVGLKPTMTTKKIFDTNNHNPRLMAAL